MLVPSSFKYTQQPSQPESRNSPKDRYDKMRRSTPECVEASTVTRQSGRFSPISFKQPCTTTTTIIVDSPPPPSTKPLSIPSRNNSKPRRSADSMRTRERSSSQRSRDTIKSAVHQKDALPPSVAALLAMTSIPPPTKTKARRKSRESSRRISIDELVSEWKQEAATRPSIGSHRSMDVLLEDTSGDERMSIGDVSPSYDSYSASRSNSADSVPSLALDQQSLISLGDPATPSLVRSLRASSVGASRRTKSRASLSTEEASSDHPLIPSLDIDTDLDITYTLTPSSAESTPRKTSFRSNLTLSFQALKSKALSSLAQLHLNTTATGNQAVQPYAFSDATLWQHPFMFPRVGPEIRPQPFNGTPTKSQRRYFNPSPLNFDEDQGYFREALHAPLNLEGDDSEQTTMIQMQTYNRSGKPKQRKSTRQDSNSEAGRALSAAGSPLMRQREPRENSDFLRVVVLEMNMRREGKLEETMPGRARIWLPPRKSGALLSDCGQEKPCKCRARGKGGVPRRWRGVKVDDL